MRASRFFLAALAFASQCFALAPGDHDVRFQAGALERHYIVHVPPQPGPRPALVLNFHGGGANARVHKEYVRMDALADRERFIVVYPDGTGPVRERFLTWNAGACCGLAAGAQVDDVGFVRALLDDLAGRLAYDPRRVYATGLSNGAMMSYRLAAELSGRIAAIAPVAGSMVLVRFAPARAVPVMHIHSVDDGRALYRGGLGAPYPLSNTRVLHPPVEERLAEWARANGCGPEPEAQERREWARRPGTKHTATRYAYPGCSAETVLWKLTGAGHVWPGGVLDYLSWLLGPGTRVIDANEEMWRFFSRHKRNG
ncbi:MAG: polyhydroxybutyrate depolymerase [Betaproteobacteria bacterium]|nr:polyhydroxybutyrate depolymerase [Betaproteobacteria bacterium]